MKTTKLMALALVILVSTAFVGTKATLSVDTGASTVKWTGYHLAKSYEHWGNVSIKSGSLEMDGDKLTGGEIVIDMTTITNGDIEKEEDNTKLVNHLKNEDFFAVSQYPNATLKIKGSEKDGNKHTVKGDLTVRGITKEITFDATQEDTEEGTAFVAVLKVDRTAHKVMYGWTLENAILSNEFQLEINLVASN